MVEIKDYKDLIVITSKAVLQTLLIGVMLYACSYFINDQFQLGVDVPNIIGWSALSVAIRIFRRIFFKEKVIPFLDY